MVERTGRYRKEEIAFPKLCIPENSILECGFEQNSILQIAKHKLHVDEIKCPNQVMKYIYLDTFNVFLYNYQVAFFF